MPQSRKSFVKASPNWFPSQSLSTFSWEEHEASFTRGLPDHYGAFDPLDKDRSTMQILTPDPYEYRDPQAGCSVWNSAPILDSKSLNSGFPESSTQPFPDFPQDAFNRLAKHLSG